MPIYEYRCGACRRKSSVFFRTLAETETKTPTCSNCGSTGLTRLVSPFAFRPSWGESLAFPGEAMDDYDENDPQSMNRWLHRMKQEAGEGYGREMEEMIDQMESGEAPNGLDDEGDVEDDGP